MISKGTLGKLLAMRVSPMVRKAQRRQARPPAPRVANAVPTQAPPKATSVAASKVADKDVLKSELYFERQSGDNCKLHAINMAIGRKVVDSTTYLEQCPPEFKGAMPSRIDTGLHSDGTSDMTFFLEKFSGQMWVVVSPALRSYFPKSLDELNDWKISTLVCYNEGHAWAMRKNSDNVWQTLDSLRRGPTPAPTTISAKLYIIFPVSPPNVNKFLSAWQNIACAHENAGGPVVDSFEIVAYLCFSRAYWHFKLRWNPAMDMACAVAPLVATSSCPNVCATVFKAFREEVKKALQ
jgi:hypothetical protein